MAASVTFDAPEKGPDSGIVVRPLGPNLFAVNLGFLKHNHKYNIAFCLPNQHSNYTLHYDPLQSLNIHVNSIERSESPPGHNFDITFTAAKGVKTESTLSPYPIPL